MSNQQLSIGCWCAVVPFDAVISAINSNGGAKELKGFCSLTSRSQFLNKLILTIFRAT
jgi:hypothetical protein